MTPPPQEPSTRTQQSVFWRVLPWLCWLALLASASTSAALAADDPPLLAVEDAFRFEAVPRGPMVRVRARAHDGYYLYRDRISVESRTPGVELGTALMPPGEDKDDPLFGQVRVYRGVTRIDIPVLQAPPAGTPFELAVNSQGCADLGVCYPPDVRIVQVTLGTALGGAGSAVNPLVGLVSDGVATQAAGQSPLSNQSRVLAAGNPVERLDQAFGDAASPGIDGLSDNPFLPVDEAFVLQAPRFDAGAAIVAFDVAPGYYLYRSRMAVEVLAPEGVTLKTPQLPAGKLKHDEYFGEQEVYYRGVSMRVPVQGAQTDSAMQLKIFYQGCADAGLCYPPQERVMPLRVLAAGGERTAAPGPPFAANGILSETDRLALSISADALGLVLGTFFLAGLLLAFTPCVLPMIPILSAIIAGQRDSPHAKSGFSLALVYVLAMSLAYTAAGVIAGLFGQNLQALFQHPAVLIGFSVLFVMLALAMFGLYELQMPVALQTRLAAFSHKQRGGSYLGVGVMGVLSALIVGPCVAAPLAAALIVIGSAGDPLRGGLALFALSLGMGVPLLAVGAFGPRLLPRAGPWMLLVKQLFGVMLLAVAIYLLSRLLAEAVVLALWSALALLGAILIFRSGVAPATPGAAATPRRSAARVAISLGVAAYAVALAIGAASGARDPLRPLASVLGTQHGTLRFERVKSVTDLDRVVAQAQAEGRMVMMDFYADWCVSCIEMEREAFADPGVHAALADAMLIQADVTVYDAQDQALLERFGLYGPPAILFFDRDGRERRAFRVIGFMNANDFQSHVTRARQS